MIKTFGADLRTDGKGSEEHALPREDAPNPNGPPFAGKQEPAAISPGRILFIKIKLIFFLLIINLILLIFYF